ncbi:MAG: DMT family transporter [Thermodesulfovibrionales bacterium]|jgi:drug/metabolite transporter (DMT)-like permease
MFSILSAIALWSSLGVVIRYSGMPAALLLFFPCLISVSIIGLMILRTDLRKDLPGLRGMASLLLLAVISLVNTFSFYYAYQKTSIANAVLTHYTAPVIVAFLAPFILKERITARAMGAVALASAGLWIMLGISAGEFLDAFLAGDGNTIGIVAGLVSGLAYALLIIVIRKLSQGFHPLVLTFFQNLFIALMLIPFLEIPGNVSSSLWAFAVMGVIHSTVAPILYFRGVKFTTANRTAILGYIEPVLAIIWGLFFFSEAVDIKTVTGGAMILLSGYLTIRE